MADGSGATPPGGTARPAVHFTPPAGWLNDPNGLVHAGGRWHLAYQHHPASIDVGPMHWGHAVSRDLLSWSDLPVALHPDPIGQIFSGSAVVDHRGDAGAGPGALVACYTQWTPQRQVQSIATSTDGGDTWQPLAANPVLVPPPGVEDFRDPKLLRHGGDDGHWVMVLAAGDGVWLYASRDLRRWEPTGRFHPERGRPYGTWECPDLFPLAVDGTGRRRWVLVCGADAGAPAGGSGTRWWVGDFDGAAFTADGASRWADHGADFYAAQSWSDAPDGRRTWLAWMSNWAYAARVPAAGWRGRMTLPRDVGLVDGPDGPVPVQRPVGELEARLGPPSAVGARPVVVPGGAGVLRLAVPHGGHAELAVATRDGIATVRCHAGGAGGGAGEVAVRRDGRDAAAVGSGFAATHRAALPAGGPAGERGPTDVEVVLDRGSIEVFAAGGRVCLTDLLVGFDGPDDPTVAVTDGGADARLRPILPATAAPDAG